MDFTEVVAEMRALRKDVQAIREEMRHYRGFAQGVAWCLSAVAGAVGFVWGLVFGN